jgi:hypothetical protein
MKRIIFSALTIGTIVFSACNNSSNEQDGHDVNHMNKDSSQHAMTTDDKDLKAVTVTYANLDATVAASFKEIVDHYLHIKSALANDNGNEAALGAKAMEGAISKLDKSLLTADQKKVYDEIEDDLKDHAEHIGKNGDNISHERERFSMLSGDVYDLVKAFGSGRALYHDHCPMYNENKGAMWLSETEEVKNPYFGAKMPTCGTVEEVINKF